MASTAVGEVTPLLDDQGDPTVNIVDDDDDDESSSEELSTWEFVVESFKDMGRSFIDCPWLISSYIKLAVLIVILTLFVLGVTVFKKYIQDFFENILGPKIKALGWYGPPAYGGLYAILTPTLFPMSTLSLAAGVVFDEIYIAIPTVWVGATLGLLFAFLLGRFAFSNWAQKKVNQYPVFMAMQSAISSKGFVMVLLLRLSPVIPFSLLNYILAISGVTWYSYLIASALGILPGTALFVYLSWSGTNALKSNTTSILQKVLTFGVGGVVTILLVIIITFVARSQIQKELKKQRRAERQAAREAKKQN